MAFIKFCAKATCYLLVLLLAGLWLKPQAAFSEQPIQHTPWQAQLQSVSLTDDYQIERSDSGAFKVSFNTELIGVSPQMLHWFYQNQADKSAEIGNEKHSWYKFSHPIEHSEIIIVESPDSHSDRIMSGTVFYQREKIGVHELNLKFQVTSFGDEGMSLQLMHSGYVVGQLDYIFKASPEGTEVSMQGKIGLDIPLIGPISNFYLFNKVYPSYVMETWLVHMLETYQHKQIIIPKLYSQKSKNRFTLS